MTLGKILILRKEGFCAKAEKRRPADYSTSEMVKLCGMKASSTFENKRDKYWFTLKIDPGLILKTDPPQMVSSQYKPFR